MRRGLLVLIHLRKGSKNVSLRDAQRTKFLMGFSISCCGHDTDEHVVAVWIITVLEAIRAFRELEPAVTYDAGHGSFPKYVVPALKSADGKPSYLVAHNQPHSFITRPEFTFERH